MSRIHKSATSAPFPSTKIARFEPEWVQKSEKPPLHVLGKIGVDRSIRAAREEKDRDGKLLVPVEAQSRMCLTEAKGILAASTTPLIIKK
jgi:hypothetical protein